MGGSGNSCQIAPDLNKKVSYIFDRRKLVEFDKYGEEILDKKMPQKNVEAKSPFMPGPPGKKRK